MLDKNRDKDSNSKEAANHIYRISFKKGEAAADAASKRSEATYMVKASEKSLVKKNEYENIHKVFSLKDLNIKFRTILETVGTGTKFKLASTKSWSLKDKLNFSDYKTAVILVLVLFNVVLLLSGLGVRYKVYINNQYMGVVNGKPEIIKLMDEAAKQISAGKNEEVCFDSQPVFRPIITWKSKKVNPNEVVENLKTKVTFKRKGYAISVNGAKMVVVSSRRMAESLLDKVKEPFKKTPDTKVEFVENVEIKEEAFDKLNSISFNEALNILNKSKEVSKTYKVQKGDTLWVIAHRNGMTLDQITELNPDMTEVIKEGQEIKLNKPVPMITVRTGC